MDDTLTRTLSPPTDDMSGVLSSYKLLTQISSLPCSSGAAAFLSLAPSESQRFPLALDVLLPVLQDRGVQPSHRILAAYVLHALYASHDHLNPFHDHLLNVFDSECTAIEAHGRTFHVPASSEMFQESAPGVQGENEQLVWVLWKILKGEGEDLAPYSPSLLSRTALPEHLRAARLIIQSPQVPSQHTNANPQHHFDSRHSPFDTRSTSTSSPTHLPYYEREPSLAYPRSPADSIARSSPSLNRTQSTSTFLPYGSENIRHSSEGRNMTSQWHHEADVQGFHHDQPRTQFDLQSRPEADSIQSQRNVTPAHEASLPSTMGDTRQEALLYALLVEPPTESNFPPRGVSEAPSYLKATNSESNDRSKEIFGAAREPGPSLGFVPDFNPGLRGPLMQQAPTQYSPTSPISSRNQRQFSTAHTNGLSSLGRQFDASASSFHTATPSSNNTISRSNPGPIARPKASPSPFYKSASPEVAPAPETGSNLQRLPSQTYSQAAGFSLVDRSLQQSAQTVSSGGSVRNPGVIGSGRPSTKSISPVGSDAGERERHSDFGVIGNGRPRRTNTTPAGLMPRSLERPELRAEENIKRDFGAIGRPNGALREVEELSTGRKDQLVIDKSLTQTSSQRISKELNLREDSREFMNSTPPSELSRHEDPSKPRLFRVNTSSSNSSLTEEASRTHSPIFALTSSLNQLSIPPPKSSPMNVEANLPTPQLGNAQGYPVCAEEMDTHTLPEIDEKERDELSRAIVLLLSARERVLTLAEQRLLMPRLSMLARPLSLLRPGDFHPLVAKNPEVATKLLVLLLDRDDDDGAKIERTLRKVSKHDMFRPESAQKSLGDPSSTRTNAVDAVQNVLQFVTGGSLSPGSAGQDKFSPFGGREAKEGYLEALRRLPPTMQSFNLIARLLRPVPSSASSPLDDQETPEGRVARLIRSEVLGGLVNGCVRWIEEAEQGEKDGEVLDDRVAVSVSSLSRFYTSLLKHGFASAESEVDTTEIMSFALQFSRFEEARSLYSTLAAARA